MLKRYELHNHTNQSDASITCEQLVEHMEKDGVDVFALTDHNTISGHHIVQKKLAEGNYRVRCVYGMEYTTYFGHILSPNLKKYVPWDSINRHKPELLFEACKRKNAVTGVAHPFSYGDPFARGCRFEMDISDYSDVDYIEVINNPEPLHEVNGPGIEWWESLVLRGEKLSACAGMDLHTLADMSMQYATYAEGEEGGDPVAELRAALEAQRTWVSNGLLLVWEADGGCVRFSIADARKPGFRPSERYVMTLRNAEGVREFDITSGSLTLPLSDLAGVEIPKLYGGCAALENLICIAPVIRR